MGGSSSKVSPGGLGEASMTMKEVRKELPALRKAALEETVEKKLLFDAHCYFFDYMQKTEGVEKLIKSMGKNGVGYAALCGTSFKKTWVGETDEKGVPKPRSKPPAHHLYDDGDLYYYSQTDGNLYRHLLNYKEKFGPASLGKFSMMACGMNLCESGTPNRPRGCRGTGERANG